MSLFQPWYSRPLSIPFVGKLSIFKVMSGELNSGATVYNANKDVNEKTTALYMLKGKKQNQITKITAGDIGAFAKLQQTETGDTLCDVASPIIYKGIEFPEPAISMAKRLKRRRRGQGFWRSEQDGGRRSYL